MELVLFGSDSKSHRKISSKLLLDAGRNGNDELARHLLNEGGANIHETNEDGQTSLHLAVLNSHESMISLLIENGADIEASTKDGSKPLYIAATSGNLSLAETLLFFNAKVESFNVKTQTTAFYQAIKNDHEMVAKILLECGADIDAKVPNGRTALYEAIALAKADLVKFLLQNGANKKLLDEEEIGELFTNGEIDQEILNMFERAQLVQGPSINNSKKAFESRFTHVPSLPATEGQVDRLNACHGFDATIVDFFIGDREERVQVSASVFDILYGIGPEATMIKAKDPKISGAKPKFRWYHLPANNMAWVEALVSRLIAEVKSGAAMLDDDLKSNLGLSNASGRQYRASTAHSSFMRPLCRAVKSGPICSFGDSTADHVMVFMPFLHFEAHDAYEEMFSIISEVKCSVEKGRNFPPTSMEMPLGRSLERKKPIRFKDGVGRKFTFPFHLVATWAGMEHLINQAFLRVDAFAAWVQEGHYDLTGPNGEVILPQVWEEIIEPDWTITMHLWPKDPGPPGPRHGPPPGPPHRGAAAPPPPPPPPGWQSGGPPIIVNPNIGSSRPRVSRRRKAESSKGGVLNWMARSKSNLTGKGPKKSGTSPPPHPGGTVLSRPHSPEPPPGSPPHPPQPHSQPLSQHSSLPTELPSEALLSTAGGAFVDPSKMNKSETQSTKDDDVAPVHTNVGTESKLSLSPENIADQDAGQERPSPPTPSHGNLNSPKPKGKQPERTDTQPGGPSEHRSTPKDNPNMDLIMGYLFPANPGEIPPLQPRRTLDQYFYTHLESTSQRDADQVVYRYTSTTSEAKIFMVDQLWLWILNEDIVISCFPQRWQPEATLATGDDALDVHQTIIRYLKGSARAPIATIYDMANLITNSCANVFDQYSVPDAFQFLDFFERSIGNIINMEAQCLQEFTDSLNLEDVVLEIKKETALLVEIKDISDELDILQIVLDDQKKTMQDMAQVTQELTKDSIATVTSKDENLSLKHNRVLDSHLYRIGKMRKMTENSYKGLQHLLDLKQKQANFSEALSARKQADRSLEQAQQAAKQARLTAEQTKLTAEQTRLTTDQIQVLNAQTKLARKQADEMARQGEETVKQGEETARQGKETARQGKTILMFTVVTIIFLPLSFMAAFFAINLESFPVNENGKLPISFVLKYMLSISGALSIPFVAVAFQQERISNWLKKVPWVQVLIWAGAIVVIVVPIALVWTRPLASGVKAAVTIALALIAATCGVGYIIYKVIILSRDTGSSSSSGSVMSD